MGIKQVGKYHPQTRGDGKLNLLIEIGSHSSDQLILSVGHLYKFLYIKGARIFPCPVLCKMHFPWTVPLHTTLSL